MTRYAHFAFVILFLSSSCAHVALAQRIAVDPARAAQQTLVLVEETTKLGQIQSFESGLREVLRQQQTLREIIGAPVVPDIRPATPAIAGGTSRIAPSLSSPVIFSSTADKIYADYRQTDAHHRAALTVIRTQTEILVPPNQQMNQAQLVNLRLQLEAQTAQARLVSSAQAADTARAKVLLLTHAVAERSEVADRARNQRILQLGFFP
ncbi:MAG: hypothetical protein Q8N18_20445 [Opitutaceae bacterium]|nr:hypothetical protein [Opitutaceae bacterium]